ncbi:MAG: SCP2 sterol-binding domain-containing protein [Planctomycetes bacterium]|nr:SCP2 sterol-binding domain-containing protein [Planctomycetota bacterium]
MTHTSQPSKTTPTRTRNKRPIDPDWIREICLAAGADDVGFVSIDNEAVRSERDRILPVFPKARTLVSFVVRTSRGPLRSPDRSLANNEFHARGHDVDDVGRALVRALEDRGIEAINPSMGFPMNMDNWPEPWLISHKPIAVAAGLGAMGIHRCVIHPKFGNFILLGTVILEEEVAELSQPLDYNPCLKCKLCVAGCPTGAIKSDGAFDFSACYTHNYREFMTGFGDWVETVADSGSAKEYRKRVEDKETVSMWQSLGFGPNYKAAYCIGVCPAGEDVIAPFLDNRKGFLNDVVKPLQKKEEVIYAMKGSDAADYVTKRFPHKELKHVSSGLRPVSAASFIRFLPFLFQPGQSKGLDAVYHFDFNGAETQQHTVRISDATISVEEGLIGKADLHMRADSKTWVAFLRKDVGLLRALITRKIKLSGDPRLLIAFSKCFPS